MMDKLAVTDMHTGGEPLRIITSGYPALPKGTILEKRAYVRDNLDHLRKIGRLRLASSLLRSTPYLVTSASQRSWVRPLLSRSTTTC